MNFLLLLPVLFTCILIFFAWKNYLSINPKPDLIIEFYSNGPNENGQVELRWDIDIIIQNVSKGEAIGLSIEKLSQEWFTHLNPIDKNTPFLGLEKKIVKAEFSRPWNEKPERPKRGMPIELKGLKLKLNYKSLKGKKFETIVILND